VGALDSTDKGELEEAITLAKLEIDKVKLPGNSDFDLGNGGDEEVDAARHQIVRSRQH
jgi:hypothetical protein